MDPLLFFGIGVSIVALTLGVRPVYRKIRRKNIIATKFSNDWHTSLQKTVPLYSKLPEKLRVELQNLIKVFISEKRFVGCGGLEVTEEMRLVIAAQACMLLLNRKSDYYTKLSVIYIYPSAFTSQNLVSDEAGVVHTEAITRVGESWGSGKVYLSWETTKKDALIINDGHNVAFHEFAHQLDSADGSTDGAPVLSDATKYTGWANVLGREYEKLQRRKGKTLLDKYGATNPAEFFAVATETFFEKPNLMARRLPDLYEELKDFYSVDPASW